MRNIVETQALEISLGNTGRPKISVIYFILFWFLKTVWNSLWWPGWSQESCLPLPPYWVKGVHLPPLILRLFFNCGRIIGKHISIYTIQFHLGGSAGKQALYYHWPILPIPFYDILMEKKQKKNLLMLLAVKETKHRRISLSTKLTVAYKKILPAVEAHIFNVQGSPILNFRSIFFICSRQDSACL